MASPEVEYLLELREYHDTQLKRCNDALALLKTAAQQLLGALSLPARVSARATGQRRTLPPGTTLNFVREHADFDPPMAAREIDRLHQAATAAGLPATRSAISSAYYLARKTLKPHARQAAPTQGQPKQSKAASRAAKQRAEKKSGTRPIDYVREVFRGTGHALTREQVIEQAQLADRVKNTKYLMVSATKVLEAMVRAHEVKRTKEGSYVAHKLLPPASNNGASA